MVWFVFFVLALALWLRTAMDIACMGRAGIYQQVALWSSMIYVNVYPMVLIFS
jgi:hypothetical protein